MGLGTLTILAIFASLALETILGAFSPYLLIYDEDSLQSYDTGFIYENDFGNVSDGLVHYRISAYAYAVVAAMSSVFYIVMVSACTLPWFTTGNLLLGILLNFLTLLVLAVLLGVSQITFYVVAISSEYLRAKDLADKYYSIFGFYPDDEREVDAKNLKDL